MLGSTLAILGVLLAIFLALATKDLLVAKKKGVRYNLRNCLASYAMMTPAVTLAFIFVLLPIIYFIYNNPDYAQNVVAIKAYLVRAILFTYFQSGTTSKLQQMKNNIINFNMEITIDMLDQMNELRVSDGKIEDIINSEKGSRVASEALYFISYEYLNRNFKYEQDHLHPAARFDSSKPVNITYTQWNTWRGNRNRLPNLHLLEGRSNGSKNDMRLIDYYNDMNDEQKSLFCKQSLIPDNVSLELSDFEVFYEERKKLLISKLKELFGV